MKLAFLGALLCSVTVSHAATMMKVKHVIPAVRMAIIEIYDKNVTDGSIITTKWGDDFCDLKVISAKDKSATVDTSNCEFEYRFLAGQSLRVPKIEYADPPPQRVTPPQAPEPVELQQVAEVEPVVEEVIDDAIDEPILPEPVSHVKTDKPKAQAVVSEVEDRKIKEVVGEKKVSKKPQEVGLLHKINVNDSQGVRALIKKAQATSQQSGLAAPVEGWIFKLGILSESGKKIALKKERSRKIA